MSATPTRYTCAKFDPWGASVQVSEILEMWANAQPDARPAEYRRRPLFNAAKFG